MHFSTLSLLSLSALSPLVNAVGNAIVLNELTAPVYLWSVGSSVGPAQIVPPGEAYSEPFRVDPSSGGIAIKITATENGLYDGSPQTIFSYSLVNDRVFYDLSDVYGDAFSGDYVALAPSDPSCPLIVWQNGVPGGGSNVKDCQSEANVTLNLG